MNSFDCEDLQNWLTTSSGVHNPKKEDLCLKWKTLRNNTCMDTASKIEEKAHKQRRDSFTWHSHNSM